VKKPGEKRFKAIDWQRIRQRLARAIKATEAAQDVSPARARELMDERAHALAQPAAEARPDVPVLDVVVFHLAGERYAVEARHVREAVRLTDLTPVPGAPEFLAGVINLRGQILPVIELGKFFGIGGRGSTELLWLLVLGGERAEFGVLAEAASEVIRLRADGILEPAAAAAAIPREHLRGVTADALIVLDGAALLREPRLVIDQGEETGA
jgi:purine-binding chemotaxis protein CheW